MLGSFCQDIRPIVPLPEIWKVDSQSPPHLPRPVSTISTLWKLQFPMQTDWISIFDDLVQLLSLDQAFNEEQLALATTSGSWIEPTIYRLLNIRPLEHGVQREYVIEEICRLGTLLFLSPIWRFMGQSPVRTDAISHNLLTMLSNYMIDWGDLKPALIWAVYFAAIETRHVGERSKFTMMLAILMNGMRLSAFQDLMQVIKRVLWVEKLFSGTDDLIRDEVLRILQRKMIMQSGPELSLPGSS